MKKLSLILISATLLFITNLAADAQEDEPQSVFVVTKITVTTPEGGSLSELDSLSKIYHEKIVVPNEKILSQKSMMHYYGSDSRDLVIITEYADWCSIEEAGNMNQELAEKAWPDKEVRQEFFGRMMSYYKTHSDEIYRDLGHISK